MSEEEQHQPPQRKSKRKTRKRTPMSPVRLWIVGLGPEPKEELHVAPSYISPLPEPSPQTSPQMGMRKSPRAIENMRKAQQARRQREKEIPNS